jgi:hypothetical protein
MILQNEWAVSPVVGVMLMLIVVIIIASVVSGFVGGLIGGKNLKDPQLAMDVSIANSGDWSTSYLKGEVTATSAPINTRDLKIVTFWKKSFNNGSFITGGATTTPGVVNFNAIYSTHGSYAFDLWRLTVPQGYGTGVGQNSTYSGNIFWTLEGGTGTNGDATLYDLEVNHIATNNSWWGNYYLQAGTLFLCRPFGGSNSGQSGGNSQMTVGYGVPNATAGIRTTRYQYVYSTSPYSDGACKISMDGGTGALANLCGNYAFYPYPTGNQLPDPEPTIYVPSLIPGNPWDPRTYSIDQMQGVLGQNWYQLRPGDAVTMKIIYIPTGDVIWQKDVIVQGSVL